ncbi:hypothetical protein G7Y89_g3190 [Cudoniella acicularis]|uniref:Uncharacterized protein n=1 Tax=Cudoniella acicularis TaxID=354080 RepID=A0A8H4RRW3_9HELO|nr:hypothetical protein G7Y89_g3190 [Cudoniella acicularis]
MRRKEIRNKKNMEVFLWRIMSGKAFMDFLAIAMGKRRQPARQKTPTSESTGSELEQSLLGDVPPPLSQTGRSETYASNGSHALYKAGSQNSHKKHSKLPDPRDEIHINSRYLQLVTVYDENGRPSLAITVTKTLVYKLNKLFKLGAKINRYNDDIRSNRHNQREMESIIDKIMNHLDSLPNGMDRSDLSSLREAQDILEDFQLELDNKLESL